ncbi:hypothetical protein G6F46_001511 [Rhizopus delemar]|nr:hypothetical protein G6F54_000796 [Rhizopus delemar]KAG1551797.1 hypothetical protein G6F51_001627 [Rhizopus arrhizus]KAG1595772.1 hypothetical protein G6F48_000451 [Rhizopus delemar]KAG1602992.1 hypothetical protein G6F47_002257 [Rhizopus delemar]KAG1621587.1 hypothetical protein G6F46_001511 [Rhizopus delemar]
MQELRNMDDDLQKHKEAYTKNKKLYIKQCRLLNPVDLAPARTQLEKEFKTAMQKQDQKIELAMKMYDLVSRHIERLDSQVLKTGISEADWVRSSAMRQSSLNNRKRSLFTNITDGHRKRIHHSSRPNPSMMGQSAASNESEVDPNEPIYCYCNQVSFGDMIACDGENCEKEWFHYACVGLVEPPVGKWYCDYCKSEQYQDSSNSSSSSSEED